MTAKNREDWYVAELEAVLFEYVARYGLTDSARKLFENPMILEDQKQGSVRGNGDRNASKYGC